MRISDWSSDVCSSDLKRAFDEAGGARLVGGAEAVGGADGGQRRRVVVNQQGRAVGGRDRLCALGGNILRPEIGGLLRVAPGLESEGDAVVRVPCQRIVEQHQRLFVVFLAVGPEVRQGAQG